MISPRLRNLLLLSLALGFNLACGLFTVATPQPEATLNSLYTAAAETLNSMSTQGAVMELSATSTLSIPTNSPTTFPTYTPVPPLQTITRCDAAAFVTDVTYPDGSLIGRGNTFTKTWRVKNTGTCTWTTGYELVFVSGERFGAKKAIALPASVSPGKTVDLSIQMTAPNQDGRYKGYWQLRNPSGILFGFGSLGEAGIYVDVNVSGYTITGYDLAVNVCDAKWRNASKELPCPGVNESTDGFALMVYSPKMEDGTSRGDGLLTHPEKIKNGVITGKYSAIKIQAGNHFKTLIGCLYKANDCDMIFKLDYQIENGTVQSLGQWQEIYDGEYYPIDIDLSFLDGQKVKFILTILSNGSSHEDHGLWINPRITRQSDKPATATSTPSLTPTVTATPTFTVTPVTPSPTSPVPYPAP